MCASRSAGKTSTSSIAPLPLLARSPPRRRGFSHLNQASNRVHCRSGAERFGGAGGSGHVFAGAAGAGLATAAAVDAVGDQDRLVLDFHPTDVADIGHLIGRVHLNHGIARHEVFHQTPPGAGSSSPAPGRSYPALEPSKPSGAPERVRGRLRRTGVAECVCERSARCDLAVPPIPTATI